MCLFHTHSFTLINSLSNSFVVWIFVKSTYTHATHERWQNSHFFSYFKSYKIPINQLSDWMMIESFSVIFKLRRYIADSDSNLLFSRTCTIHELSSRNAIVLWIWQIAFIWQTQIHTYAYIHMHHIWSSVDVFAFQRTQTRQPFTWKMKIDKDQYHITSALCTFISSCLHLPIKSFHGIVHSSVWPKRNEWMFLCYLFSSETSFSLVFGLIVIGIVIWDWVCNFLFSGRGKNGKTNKQSK